MSARYSPTGRTSFISTFSQTLDNSERRLADSFGFIFVDENGDFLDDRTGLPFDPTEPGLSFDSGTVRQDSFRLTMTGSRGRNNFSLSGFFNERSSDRLGTDEFVIGGNASFGRSLSRAMRANVNLSYRNTDFDTADGREDDFYTAGLNLSYRLASDLSTALTYNFTLRDSSISAGDLHENAVSVRLSKSF
ncbi:MAG: outer membrane beta-barrel protein [Alphaproteobacteria bacterium]